ncbi:hypothetical protein AC579_7825 [Pseudocercospora musae]|uniref:Uncharacterized protein n=1 Tax=Pseudocercospora musae TaxID=113226 RepID=A0A139I439_9PEZI|nr:hypothetical protein AC579_7825 [Pseudocercospora musae]
MRDQNLPSSQREWKASPPACSCSQSSDRRIGSYGHHAVQCSPAFNRPSADGGRVGDVFSSTELDGSLNAVEHARPVVMGALQLPSKQQTSDRYRPEPGQLLHR